MTVNSYLATTANKAIIRDAEKVSIQKSINGINSKLSYYFGDNLSDQLIFGSYNRGTILPRRMDQNSDIDYMLIFNSTNAQPQAYLDRLRRFVSKYYPSSFIAQSHPTIVLSLNHIRFELVPAINSLWSGLQIPAKASDYEDWINTDPTDFNEKLISANRDNKNLIKPLVRLVKYWNAKNGYVFDSYKLEQEVVNHGYFFVTLFNGQLKDYFYEIMSSLDVDWYAAQWRKDKISRLHRLIELAKQHEQQGLEERATGYIKKIVPPILLPAGLNI